MRDGGERAKRTSGFTLVELVVVVAITIILLSITIPAFKTWLPNYQLKSAAMDIFTSLQRAKSEAIRANSPYAVVFNSGGGSYQIGTDLITLSNYGSSIVYGHGDATNSVDGAAWDDDITYAGNTLSFDSKGMSNSGYVYLQNNSNRTYAVGTFASGVVRIRRWDGSAWN
jgi:Tfp pilus assembly protein FimT